MFGSLNRGNLALLCSLVGEGGSWGFLGMPIFFPWRKLPRFRMFGGSRSRLLVASFCYVAPSGKNWLRLIRVNEITPPWGKGSKKQQMGLGNFGVICRLKDAISLLVSYFMTPAVRFLHSLLLLMDEKTWFPCGEN